MDLRLRIGKYDSFEEQVKDSSLYWVTDDRPSELSFGLDVNICEDMNVN